jgi:hypothetical protein
MRTALFAVGLVILAIALSVGAAGCREKRVIICKANEGYDPNLGVCYQCPEGTKGNPKTAKCVPIPKPDVLPDAEEPSDWVSLDDAETPDSGGTELPDVPEVDEELPPVVDVVPSGFIGASCNTDNDCDPGFSCFDWPKGYCIKMDCTADTDCPAGTVCLPLVENGQACFDLCADDGECRPGYGCKAIPTSLGNPKPICHPVGEENKEPGQACEGHSECAGSLACIPLGPGRMCLASGCSTFDPCDLGQACVSWGMMTLCLKGCSTTEECQALGNPIFVCQGVKDIVEEKADVCLPAKQGLAVGDLCYFASECQTGYCQLVVSGKCSGALGGECATDKDCTQAVCVSDPSVQKGVCSQPCGPGSLCPGGSLCGQATGEAVCLDACESYSLPCGPSGFGMTCTYGKLVYPSAPTGKYACAKIAGGEAGSPCLTEGDCASGSCYGIQAGKGYCATKCASDAQCPFGSQCLPGALVPGSSLCARICFSDLDCPQGFACKNTIYTEKACQLD